MDFYQRKLPHWQPRGAEYFITFRLADSLPKETIEVFKEMRREFRNLPESNQEKVQRKVFLKYEQVLDEGSMVLYDLKIPLLLKLFRKHCTIEILKSMIYTLIALFLIMFI